MVLTFLFCGDIVLTFLFYSGKDAVVHFLPTAARNEPKKRRLRGRGVLRLMKATDLK